MWVFEVIFKIIKIKLKIPFLSCTCHISSAQRSDVACGYHIEPHRERTFASLQTVLLDKPGLSKMGLRGLHWWLRGKESICQGRRHRFESWVWKIPHAVEQLSPCATMTEPVIWSLGASTTEVYMPKSPSSESREAAETRSLATRE